MSLPEGRSNRNSKRSAAQQALLQKWLSNTPGEKVQIQGIPRRSRQDSLPLSFAQQRLWFIHQLEPDNAAYVIPLVLRLTGQLNINALEQSINTIIERHEILRTTFTLLDGNPVQRIASSLHLPLRLVDLHEHPEPERETLALQITAQEVKHPFDLTQGPLLTSCLLRLSDEEHILQIVIHHILTDAIGFDVFKEELLALYEAYVNNQPSPLAELPIQYADFTLWQRAWLQGEILEKQLAYWKRYLHGAATALDLLADHPRPALQTFRGTSLVFGLSEHLTAQIKALCATLECTLFQILFAAYQVLLFRYSGQEDFLIGTPIANRTHPDTEKLVGLFINTLVLRTSLAGNPSFREMVLRIRNETLEAYAHQDVPFEKLVEILQPKRDLSRNPLFQVMFVFRNDQRFARQLTNLQVQLIRINNEAVQFDLNLSMADTDGGLKGALEYNADLFDQTTASRLLGHLQMLLESIVAHPHQRVSDLPLLTPPEQRQLLVEWNATSANFPLQRTFHDLFTEQAGQTPDAIALVYRETRMTYRELHARSNQMAHLLRTHGVSAEALVGIYMERSPEILVAILATFKAGGAYVPLDPAYPPEHRDLILQDARPVVIVTQPRFRPLLSAQAAAVVSLDATWQTLAPYSNDDLVANVIASQLAYVIFTSGSTGRPKGAMLTHRGMLNHLFAKIHDLKITAADCLAQTASHCFDISVWQFLSPLLVGGQVHIFSNEITHQPELLLEQMIAARITIVELVPSLLRAILDGSSQHMAELKRLRWLVATGEALPADLCRRWFQEAGTIPMVNAYGPTECSDDVTHCMVNDTNALREASVPIGRTIANTQIYILDKHLAPVPIGIPGQIYVGGTGVGRGYLGDPMRTAAVFLPDPFGDLEGNRLYQTGDLARYLADGTIEFLGRIDHQVKLRGFRIELGEIEAALSISPQVQDNIVMLREDLPGQQRLVAYVVAKPHEDLSPGELRRHLKERLPEYMVPSAFVALQALPLMPNGKIDRRALPEPEEQQLLDPGVSYVPPGSTLERTIARIWQEVLHIEKVGMQDNFFDLGGHSLLIVQVHRKLTEALPETRSLTMIELFRYPTISALAERIGQHDHAPIVSPSLSIGQSRAQSRREAMKRLRDTTSKR